MTTWSTASGGSAVWINTNADFKDTWGDWGSITWGTIQNAGLTWDAMGGYTFLNTTGNTTTWVAV